MKIKLSYSGTINELEVADNLTAGAFLSNAAYQTVFGFTGKEDALVAGTVLGAGDALQAGDTVSLQTKAGSKGQA